MADEEDTNEDDAQPIGQDLSLVNEELQPEPVTVVLRRRGNSVMNWNQYFGLFRNQVSKRTADFLVHVEGIGMSRP